MAADAALGLPRVSQALRTFTGSLSQPEAQPEFRSLQASLPAPIHVYPSTRLFPCASCCGPRRVDDLAPSRAPGNCQLSSAGLGW